MTSCSVTCTVPVSATRPTSLRPEVDQHQVLGELLGVGQQLGSSARSSSGVAPRRRVPAIGRTVTVPSSRRTRISGEEPTIVEVAEVEIEHVGRWIQAAQRAVEVQRRCR